MKYAVLVASAAALLCVGVQPAFAATAKQIAQQQKMSACSHEGHAKALKGDAYKAFMSECLKADAPAPAATNAKPMTQQDKMKACNADPKAQVLKGDDRKKFMSDCLSAPAH